jgi:hypothetical protein
MIKKLLLIITLKSLLVSQSTFTGLKSWTHSNTIGLSGGGYLIPYQNEFRNAAMLAQANRLFQLNLIKYPADINAQSIIVNGIYKEHHLGFSIRHINYGIFESRTTDNVITGNFSASDTHIQMGYAKYLYKNKLIVGFNSGLFLSQIENSNASAITISPSLLLKADKFVAALTLENYGKVIDSYGNSNESMHGSIVFSISRYLENYPIQIEFDQITYYGLNNTSHHLSALYKTKNNINLKGGISSNRSDRINSNQLSKDIFNDIGIGIGYEFDNLTLDFNTYSYSNSNFIYGIAIASRF